MLTILASPKPFDGHIGVIQRNAIQSWTQLTPRPQIILFGDSAGTRQIAAELGVEHLPEIETNDLGTPLLRAVLRAGEERAHFPLLCYINGDIILTEGFQFAVRAAPGLPPRFLMVGARVNLDLDVPIEFDASWRRRLDLLARGKGTPGDHTSIDFFVFPKGFYRNVPDLAIGRAWFDQWMIKEAVRQACVIDLSPLRPIIHQNHGYGHLAGGRSTAYAGVEAERNMAIYGDRPHAYTLLDATHQLGPDGQLRRVLFRKQLHRARHLVWDLLVRRTAPFRHAIGMRRSRNRSQVR